MADFDIMMLLKRERVLHDTRQWEEFRSCYVADTAKTFVSATWFQGDVDAYIAYQPFLQVNGLRPIQQIDPVKIDIQGERAVAEAYLNGSFRFTKSDDAWDLTWLQRVLCRLVREGQSWKIVSFTVIHIKDGLHPAEAKSVGLGGLGIRSKWRKSYARLTYVFKQTDLNIRDDLLGEDHPETVEQLRMEHSSWLVEL